MSSSVFKELPSTNNDKIDSNLVIVVNKDGSVSVDQNTLHDFLVNKDTQNTSVSIVRVSSPTPSITDEIEQDQNEKNEMEKLNKEHDDGDEEDEEENEDDEMSPKIVPEEEKPQHVSLTVENFYPPDEARKLAGELISMAGIDNPLTIKTYEYARFVVFSDHCYTPLTSPSQKLPPQIETTPEPVKPEKAQPVQPPPPVQTQVAKPSTLLNMRMRAKKPSESADATKSDNNDTETSDNLEHQDEEEDEEEESDDDEEFSSEVSENDRDSDLDFNINDRSSLRAKKSSSGRRGRRRKGANNISDRRKRPSISAVDREMESMFSDEVADSKDDSLNKKRRGGKSPRSRRNNLIASTPISKTKMNIPRKSFIKEKVEFKKIESPKTPNNSGSGTQSNKEIHHHLIQYPGKVKTAEQLINKSDVSMHNASQHVHHNTSLEKPIPPLTAIKTIGSTSAPTTITATIIAPTKKRISSTPHVEALFSDMTSLFSTPDIIKKVNVPAQSLTPEIHKVAQPNLIIHTTHHNLMQTPPPPSSSSSSLSHHPNNQNTIKVNHIVNNSGGFMALNPVTAKSKNLQIPAHISIQTHNSAVELASEQDKQLDLIDSIVQQELGQSNALQSGHMSEDIPNIVKMLQNPVEHDMEATILRNVIENHQHVNVQQNNSSVSLPNTLDLVGSGSLLDSLNNPEDGLTEDLLQHVAELVENKNLQEIIDKQVLGVQSPTMENNSLMQNANSNPNMNVNLVTPTSLTNTSTNVTMTTVQRKPNILQKIETAKLAASIKDINRKEPIQIIRSDGRIITLPPIEAPTTRAKRRAQAAPEATATTPAKLVTATMSTSMELNKSLEPSTIITNSVGSRKNSISSKVSETSSKDGKNSRRSSTNSTTLPNNITSIPTRMPNDSDDNMDSDESWNSEDDPDRLWCICKQPHNNRFMICCDSCEEWFHGKCVNISKAMGQQMEENGIEWTCPNCIKKKTLGFTLNAPIQDLNSKPKLATKKTNLSDVTLLNCIVCKQIARPNSIYCSDDCIRKHAQNALVSNKVPISLAPVTVSQTENLLIIPDAIKTKPATVAAATVVNVVQKPTMVSTTEETSNSQSMGILRNRNRVIVFERKTGRCLAGNSAPTLENLKQWLQDNPTFEVVQPGSAQALAIKAKQLQLKQIATKFAVKKAEQQQTSAGNATPKITQTQLKIGTQKQIIIVNPQKIQTTTIAGTPAQPIAKSMVKIIKTVPQSNLKQTTLTSNVGISLKTPPAKSSPVGKELKTPPVSKSNRKQLMDKSAAPSPTHSAKEPEPIRVNVKRTLKEQLSLRMDEVKLGPRLSMEEIEEFANQTEHEMFRLFNKDTGTKYKAKYRSLMFNIKDRKNTTLFQKICDKSIEPKQLVRMSPEELASQELAQWRENENKHQLEMIKKSELDMLACTKNYVLKTHKGEEVIEGKMNDRLELDPTVAVEDVVSMLNNSTVSSTSDSFATAANTKKHLLESKFETGYHSGSSQSKSSSLTPSTSNTTTTTTTSKKKESRHSRSRSREKHESKSSKSSSSSKHKKHKNRDRRSRSRDKEKEHRSRSKDRLKRSKSRDKDKERERDGVKHHKELKIKEVKVQESKPDKEKEKLKEKVKIIKDSSHNKMKSTPILKSHSIEEYNLVDKILEASSSTVQMDEIKWKDNQTNKNQQLHGEIIKKPINMDIDQEPTSTVIIPTPPDILFDSEGSERDDSLVQEELWTGNINMIDVGTFQVALHAVSGDCDEIQHDLPGLLDIVGRISPETVWDYITKIKKSPNKEILLLRFSCNSDEIPLYTNLYQYLHERKRLGVIKTTSPFIKDFYVLPLSARTHLPNVLLPVSGPGFVEGIEKPDLLVGIVVYIKGKRSAPPSSGGGGGSLAKIRKLNSSTGVAKSSAPISQVAEEQRFTPPNSPKDLFKAKANSKLTHGLPKPDSLLVPQSKDDEPYSPEDSDDESLAPIITTVQVTTTTTTLSVTSNTANLDADEIQRKMEELNREIEAQKLEIAGILTKTQDIDEPYSPSKPVSPPQQKLPTLANIAIPSNLSEILASIKSGGGGGGGGGGGSIQTNQNITTIDLVADRSKSPEIHIPGLGDSKDEEYNPLPAGSSLFSAGGYKPASSKSFDTDTLLSSSSLQNSPSKLATLSEAELLSMVPDDIDINNKPNSRTFDEAFGGDNEDDDEGGGGRVEDDVSASKKIKWDKAAPEPPPPGLEQEYNPI